MWPPRIIANDSADEKNAEPGSSVTVCLPALMRSGSSSPSYGNGPDAEHAVLGLQDDVDAGGDEVGDQRRHADAEVDVVAVAQLPRGARGDLIAGRGGHGHALPRVLRTVRCSIGFS